MYVPRHIDNLDRVLERRTPDFLILGAAKAGTTALYTYLGQHPSIYLSTTRETNFFALEGQMPAFAGPGDDTAVNAVAVTDWQAYLALFAAAGPNQRAGEASPLYLYHPEAPARIHGRLPDVRLVVFLRNPADRAYASYLHLVRDGRETVSFEEALALEPQRIADGWEHLWHYRAMGYYGAQLARYWPLFGRDRLRVVSYDRFSADARGVVREVYAFLGVDPAFEPDVSRRPNRSGVPRSRWLHRLLARGGPLRRMARVLAPASWKGRLERSMQQALLHRPPMPAHVRTELLAGYREDLRLLQATTGFDAGPWLHDAGMRP